MTSMMGVVGQQTAGGTPPTLTLAHTAAAQATSIDVPYGGGATLQEGDTYLIAVGFQANRTMSALIGAVVDTTNEPGKMYASGVTGSTDCDVAVTTGTVPAGTGNLTCTISSSGGIVVAAFRVNGGTVQTGGANCAYDHTADSNPTTSGSVPALAAGAGDLNVAVVGMGHESSTTQPTAVSSITGWTSQASIANSTGTRQVRVQVYTKFNDTASQAFTVPANQCHCVGRFTIS